MYIFILNFFDIFRLTFTISLKDNVLDRFFIIWNIRFLDILQYFCTNDVSAQNLELHSLHLKRCFLNLRYVGHSDIFNKATFNGSVNPFLTILSPSFI